MHSVMLSVFKKGYEDLTGADTKRRTRDLLITSQLLYQLSYVGTPKLSVTLLTIFLMVPRPGIEPGTRGFSIRCSTD